ncbi:MAG TPA: hypothetical protein VLF89_02365 [Candidatus Saccharimonadales bacterium]|nr:hypothetical protein [Candidatus Saccharimonadales bacterium]
MIDSNITTFLLFYALPYIVTIALPGISIPWIVKKKFLKTKQVTGTSLLPYILPLILLPIISNLLWEQLLFNKVYYEWDRLFIPYDFFFYESPLVDGSSSWLARGWSQWHLFLIWVAITIGIYGITLVISLWYAKGKLIEKQYRKIIFLSITPFIILSLISIIYHAIKLLVTGN